MASSSTVRCARCGQAFAAAAHLMGQTVACPSCGAPITVPSYAPPSAPFVPAPSGVQNAPTAGGGPWGSNSWQAGPASNPPPRKNSAATKILLGFLAGGLLAVVVCCGGGVLWVRSLTARPQMTQYATLLEGRSGFSTNLLERNSAAEPLDLPPSELFVVEKYRSPAGELDAYVTPPPGDGKRRPAIIWVFGGFDNSIGSTASLDAPRDNDQSARAFRNAGLVMMYPSFRGGNMNPGHIEAFYGEVDDLLAAADHLAKKDYVDPNRIYLGGHSTGGTLVLLAAAASNRFRAVFSLGPVEDVTGYGGDQLPYAFFDSRENSLRNPIQWLHAIRSPVFVFEGVGGNIDSLRAMRRASTNPQIQFFELQREDHFSIIAPVTEFLAGKVVADEGPTCTIQFTDMERLVHLNGGQ